MADSFVRYQGRIYETEDTDLHQELAAMGPSQRTRWVRKLIRAGYMLEKGMSASFAAAKNPNDKTAAAAPDKASLAAVSKIKDAAPAQAKTVNPLPRAAIPFGDFSPPKELGSLNDVR